MILWKILMKDWGLRENRSLILLGSKQSLTKIGMLHKFANFRQRKDSQGGTRRANSARFLGHNLPQKGPSVICATIGEQTGLFLWHFHVPWIFGTVFASQLHQVCISWLLSFWISFSRQILNPLPSSNSLFVAQ